MSDKEGFNLKVKKSHGHRKSYIQAFISILKILKVAYETNSYKNWWNNQIR